MFENIISDAARIEQRRAIAEAERAYHRRPARRTLRQTFDAVGRYHVPSSRAGR